MSIKAGKYDLFGPHTTQRIQLIFVMAVLVFKTVTKVLLERIKPLFRISLVSVFLSSSLQLAVKEGFSFRHC